MPHESRPSRPWLIFDVSQVKTFVFDADGVLCVGDRFDTALEKQHHIPRARLAPFFAGPFFGGMSGVVYALLGFVWMKSRFDPASGFHLDKQTVIMMIGWFVLCAANVIPNVANYAHGFGLGIGMLWGFVSAKSAGSRSRRTPIFP